MGVDSWCFCKGISKSEKMKGAIFTSKASAIAHVSSSNVGGALSGTGFMIHRNLLVTTHGNLQSIAAAEASEIRLRDGVAASLFPHRFFITSSVLDLTIVGLDVIESEAIGQGTVPHYLKTCAKPNVELGSVVYLLGYTEKDELELVVGEGKVVIATDNLIKLSTDGVNWKPGSAGFDAQGNLAFMICDPMKLATSLNNSSSMSTTTSSISSVKKDMPLQFGIPVPVICNWLNQHWEGNLDEVSKPKLPLLRLMSTGHKSEHSCASFTMRRVFKSTEAENDGTPSSSNAISKARDLVGAGYPNGTVNAIQEILIQPTERPQGIPTPEIYESRKLTSGPARKKETTPVQLLDINFPPRKVKNVVPSMPLENHVPPLNTDCKNTADIRNNLGDGHAADRQVNRSDVVEAKSSIGSVNDALSEVQSCSSIVEAQQNGYSSEGETMYSAETAESRNYTSPREVHFQQVGRSQSCVNHNRWGAVYRTPTKSMLEKHKSFTQGKKMYSQGTTSQRSNDYFSPTVSSIMKKRNNTEQPSKPRPIAVHSSPKWNF